MSGLREGDDRGTGDVVLVLVGAVALAGLPDDEARGLRGARGEGDTGAPAAAVAVDPSVVPADVCRGAKRRPDGLVEAPAGLTTPPLPGSASCCSGGLLLPRLLLLLLGSLVAPLPLLLCSTANDRLCPGALDGGWEDEEGGTGDRVARGGERGGEGEAAGCAVRSLSGSATGVSAGCEVGVGDGSRVLLLCITSCKWPPPLSCAFSSPLCSWPGPATPVCCSSAAAATAAASAAAAASTRASAAP